MLSATGERRGICLRYHRESLVAAEALAKHARKRGMSPADFACLWMLNNRIVTSALAGPRTVEQWEAALGALRHEFTAEDEALVDSLVPAGHSARGGRQILYVRVYKNFPQRRIVFRLVVAFVTPAAVTGPVRGFPNCGDRLARSLWAVFPTMENRSDCRFRVEGLRLLVNLCFSFKNAFIGGVS